MNDAARWVQEAQALQQAGKFAEAEARYLQALQAQPTLETMALLSALYVQAGQPEAALHLWQQAQAANPQAAEIDILLGNTLLTLGRFGSAAASFRAALRKRPDVPEAHYGHALALHQQGRHSKAEAAAREALACRPDYSDAANLLALILLARARGCMAQNRLEEAIPYFQEGITLRPDHESGYAALASAWLQSERWQEALEVCEEGLARFPDDADLHRFRGIALIHLGRMAEAEAHFWRPEGSILTAGYLELMLPLLRECLSLPGDVIECGVYRGGTTAEFARLVAGTGKVVHACDTFAGLPESTDKDNVHRQGDFADTSLRTVEALWQQKGVRQQIVAHVGLFSETFPAMAAQTYCFALLDADYYASTREALAHVYPRLSPGGWLVLDDYGWKQTAGVKTAVDEFLADKPECESLASIFDNLWGFRKLDT